jgi:UDP:flavonoid glycosyltransferase YjiC (YdhE family)
MGRVLFVWELGHGMGHVARAAPVLHALRAAGHAVVAALSDLAGSDRWFPAGEVEVLQAPVWLHTRPGAPKSFTWPQVLLRAGWAEPSSLFGLVRAWRQLVERAQPDLLIVDHAPTAMLAARGLGVPMITIGTGFTTPPQVTPMPSFREWERADPQQLGADEDRALTSANDLLRRLGQPALRSMAELWDIAERVVCSWPELDHYGVRADLWYNGPEAAVPAGAAPAWPAGDGPRLIAYLKQDYRPTPVVLEVLRRLPARTLAYVAGMAAAEAARLSDHRLRLTAQPVDLSTIWSGRQGESLADGAVCHAGAGTVGQALHGGCPVLMLPIHAEQLLFARRAASTGAARLLTEPQVPAQLERVAASWLADGSCREAARALGAKHPGHLQDGHRRIVARCQRLMDGT